jgi:hypothetical protein
MLCYSFETLETNETVVMVLIGGVATELAASASLAGCNGAGVLRRPSQVSQRSQILPLEPFDVASSRGMSCSTAATASQQRRASMAALQPAGARAQAVSVWRGWAWLECKVGGSVWSG